MWKGYDLAMSETLNNLAQVMTVTEGRMYGVGSEETEVSDCDEFNP